MLAVSSSEVSSDFVVHLFASAGQNSQQRIHHHLEHRRVGESDVRQRPPQEYQERHVLDPLEQRSCSPQMRTLLIAFTYTSVRVQHTSVRGEHTSVRVQHTSVRGEHTSVRVQHTSVRGEHTSVRVQDHFCTGDSGSGLEHRDGLDKATLLGITSFGSRGCPSNELARFTRVANYLSRICALTGVCYSTEA
ncbi:trypsin domain-containing protein [Ditylenchus destructor]|uniref:Trypsin domain-containing protein n=1 Tax=Ditylenchus destructor TaxID=166010 RepID=A0AAD4N450_9BILA|nr:trypsin domain-containing protein [Ditylenchus destructor]